MTDPLLIRAALALEQNRTLRAQLRLLLKQSAAALHALRLAIQESAHARLEARGRRLPEEAPKV